MARILCPLNPAISIEHQLLDTVDKQRVEAVLTKYVQDGGQAPGDFKVFPSWGLIRGITIVASIDGSTWALQV